MTTETKTAAVEATPAQTIALAIPVGVARGTFTDPTDALTAVFIFGLTAGATDPKMSMALADAGETLIGKQDEYEKFLVGITAFMGGLLPE